MTEQRSRASGIAPDTVFPFGRNWQRYLARSLSPERERIAADSLNELLSGELAGRTFLDIGAGSGLFSLCAYRAGASRVVSVDVDPESVACCRALRESVGNPENWEVVAGSVLDDELLEKLEPADIVYSWGVLHHTGDMYRAICNASRLVRPRGRLAIAIYNRIDRPFFDSQRWARIKRFYNRAPKPVRSLLELGYRAAWALRQLAHGRNPARVAREYERSRGMAVTTDLTDWLGGHPYEFATAEEIVDFCERHCGLKAHRVIAADARSMGNHEFVFEREA